MKLWRIWVLAIFLGSMGQVSAAQQTIDLYRLNEDPKTKGISEKIGTISLEDSDKGLVIRTDLKGLTTGQHGFHVHENPSCEPLEKNGKWEAGAKAGGHFDPLHTGKHLGPEQNGHLGDLPLLVVDKNGTSQTTLLAPRLKLSDINKRSLIIHAGGDNYSDEPEPMGGCGTKIACGLIQ